MNSIKSSRKTYEKKDSQAGFSLLEMLLVVALIGVIAAYAVPTYQSYMQNTRFMEVVQQTQAVRLSQAACLLQAGNNLSACDAYDELTLNAPAATNNTASVDITGNTGILTGTGTAAAGGYTYTLTPSFNDQNQLQYAVGGTCVKAKAC